MMATPMRGDALPAEVCPAGELSHDVFDGAAAHPLAAPPDKERLAARGGVLGATREPSIEGRTDLLVERNPTLRVALAAADEDLRLSLRQRDVVDIVPNDDYANT